VCVCVCVCARAFIVVHIYLYWQKLHVSRTFRNSSTFIMHYMQLIMIKHMYNFFSFDERKLFQLFIWNRTLFFEIFFWLVPHIFRFLDFLIIYLWLMILDTVNDSSTRRKSYYSFLPTHLGSSDLILILLNKWVT